MDPTVIVMIVTLATPSGERSVNIVEMPSAQACRDKAQIEAGDPFVARVECSQLKDGKLELTFRKAVKRKIPQTAFERSTG